jgi:hypothetical protein
MVFVVGSIYILTKRVRIMDELLAPQGRLASENEVFNECERSWRRKWKNCRRLVYLILLGMAADIPSFP